MNFDEIVQVLGEFLVIGRSLLFILDKVDRYVPAIKRVTDLLGTALGGRKERFGGE